MAVLKRALGLQEAVLIPCGGGDPIAAAREQWNDGSNTLAIAPGVVVTYDRTTCRTICCVPKGGGHRNAVERTVSRTWWPEVYELSVDSRRPFLRGGRRMSTAFNLNLVAGTCYRYTKYRVEKSRIS